MTLRRKIDYLKNARARRSLALPQWLPASRECARFGGILEFSRYRAASCAETSCCNHADGAAGFGDLTTPPISRSICFDQYPSIGTFYYKTLTEMSCRPEVKPAKDSARLGTIRSFDVAKSICATLRRWLAIPSHPELQRCCIERTPFRTDLIDVRAMLTTKNTLKHIKTHSNSFFLNRITREK